MKELPSQRGGMVGPGLLESVCGRRMLRGLGVRGVPGLSR